MSYRRRYTEIVVPNMPLGRHVHHDPASRAYPYKAAKTLVSIRHERHIGILNQARVGSCTGDAETGALGTSYLWDALLAAHVMPASLDQDFAYNLYHLATAIDGYPGVWPPVDTGSDGLSVAKAGMQLGLLSGFQHAFTVDDALGALAAQPVIFGTDWYAGFDTPAPDGKMTIAGPVRGGHEIVLGELDVENQRVWMDNSWTDAWGLKGRAYWSIPDFTTLLAGRGDVTILNPINVPTPAPIPVPPVPPVPTDPDAVFAAEARAWAANAHASSANTVFAAEISSWLTATHR